MTRFDLLVNQQSLRPTGICFLGATSVEGLAQISDRPREFHVRYGATEYTASSANHAA